MGMSSDRDLWVGSTMRECLEAALLTHDQLGAEGEEVVTKNEHGETALRVDIACEQAILDHLRGLGMSIRVFTEEHGEVVMGKDPVSYTAIIDGLDGTSEYKRARGQARYATMFSILDGPKPFYRDYMACGIVEHARKKIGIARHLWGAHVNDTDVHTSSAVWLSKETRVYIDDYFPLNQDLFAERLEDHCTILREGSSAIFYLDLAQGDADLVLECTRKRNLEIAVAYGFVREAGGVMVDVFGHDIGDQPYRSFGQNCQIPIITAATAELARSLLLFLGT